jgi:hypothetical protein
MNWWQLTAAVGVGAIFARVVSLPPHYWMPGSSDDTDPPNRGSGLVIYTDARTGLQYLGTPSGGLTPRLDRDGRQISTNPQGN